MKKVPSVIAIVALFIAATTQSAYARTQITTVGSSTVYPFATTVAEYFGKNTEYKTPVIESTGTGGGMKLFCAGVGFKHPDVTNASRAIKKSEKEGDISEDQSRDEQENVQKLTDKFISEIDKHLQEKESDILKV